MYLVINKCVTAVKVSNFSGHYLRNRSTLDIGVLGYIGIVQHKEHSPEVLSIPPGTPCIKQIAFSVEKVKFRSGGRGVAAAARNPATAPCVRPWYWAQIFPNTVASFKEIRLVSCLWYSMCKERPEYCCGARHAQRLLQCGQQARSNQPPALRMPLHVCRSM